jgi:transcriptional regulator with XRE-family HTH domain
MAKRRNGDNRWLRQVRLDRGWSLDRAAEAVHRVAVRLGDPEPGVDGNTISRWERGIHEPGPRYVRLLCLVYDRPPHELGLGDLDQGQVVERVATTLDLMLHTSASDLDPSSIETIQRAVNRLSREYSTIAPPVLLPRVQQRLWQLDGLLGKRLTLAQHRALLLACGWLHLLLAALHYDLGDREAAESSREAALHVGVETEDRDIQGWAYETAGYFNLIDRPRDSAQFSATGHALAPAGSYASVATSVQESRAWARLGDRQAAERALSRSMKAIDRLPPLRDPQHHFVFDPAKFSHYASIAYLWLGLPRDANGYAQQSIRQFGDPKSAGYWPSRVTTAWLVRGLALASEDRADEAAQVGLKALVDDPFVRPLQLSMARQLERALSAHSDLPAVQQFNELCLLTRRRASDPRQIDW